METAMPKAYSYLRFSTPEQMKGDLHRRQSTLAQKYATEHHMDLDDTLTFKDLGVSAFRGKNAGEEGQLGAFLAAVETGKVAPGSYLLVESLDRISREAAWIALGTLTNILARGISLVTLYDGKVYSQASMTMNPMDLMYALMGFIRANDESAHKSMRLKSVWSAKRAKADKKPLTSLAPSWLRLDKETGRFQVIPECAEVVRRIFREYLSGRGPALITADLNREAVPCSSERHGKGSGKPPTGTEATCGASWRTPPSSARTPPRSPTTRAGRSCGRRRGSRFRATSLPSWRKTPSSGFKPCG
jgi:DNA invertase Pin-like site-specific DNA recombinase